MTSKDVSQMTKVEMEQKIKAYRWVIAKLHKELQGKDEEVKRLSGLVDKLTRSK